MAKSKVRIGLVGFGRVQFDMEEARKIYAQAGAALAELPGTELVQVQEVVTDIEAARTARLKLREGGADLLVILSATFSDASMLTAFIDEADGVTVPLVLWAVPEPEQGGRLRLNSLCGVNLAAYTLTSAGKKFQYIYGSPGEAGLLKSLSAQVGALSLARQMRQTRIGLIGTRPPGFYPSGFDELKLWKEVGPQLQTYNLNQVFGAAAQEVEAGRVGEVREWLGRHLHGLDELNEGEICNAAGSYRALSALAERDGLDALAVKCWPEFFVEHASAACGVLAALAENGILAACEADVHGAVTMLALQHFSGQPPFLADLVSMDRQRDSIVLWHCGNAAFSLAANPAERRAGVHANRKMAVTALFPLKPGPVVLARLSYSQGKYRLLLAQGEALDSPLLFQGNTAEVLPACGAPNLLDRVIYGGYEHHLVMAYGGLEVLEGMEAWANLTGLAVDRL
ncbi:MAG TPA: L-fucose/L-arabinose isomerase family protein [Chloroflexia bacterium]|nr:L-fucose/L-arabinose isomerase family protein [Chloroflexia bacterium]